MRRLIFHLSVFLLAILCLFSCGERRCAEDIAEEFSELLCGGVVYTKSAEEGERGYIDGEFFSLMFGEDFEFSGDWAVWLDSSLTSVSEGGVFVSDSSYAAKKTEEMLRERIRLVLGVISSSSIKLPEGIIKTYGNTVVYYVGSEPERARRAWESIF